MIKFGPDEDFQLCLNMSDTGNGGIAGRLPRHWPFGPFPATEKKNLYSRGLAGQKMDSLDRLGKRSRRPQLPGRQTGGEIPPGRLFQETRQENRQTRPRQLAPQPRQATRQRWLQGSPPAHSQPDRNPFAEAWPPRSHTTLYGSGKAAKKKSEA